MHRLDTNCFATCLDHEELRSGFPRAAYAGSQAPRTVYSLYDSTPDWAEDANKNYSEVLGRMNEAMERGTVLDDELFRKQVALASAWFTENPPLSCTAAVLGGGDWVRLSRCVERHPHSGLQHNGVLARSGRAQGLALLTQCPTVLYTLSRWRMQKIKKAQLEWHTDAELADDQVAVEAALGALVGEQRVYGRLLGLHVFEGKALRELTTHDASYRLPERWVRLFLRDYAEVAQSPALPVGVVLFDEKSERPPMDTKDPLCGQAVCLRRVETLVVLEPALLTPAVATSVLR